jgi:HPt (histidine-containing phosphotransfer) domain-containing protein
MANCALTLSDEREPPRWRDAVEPILDLEIIGRLERLGEAVGGNLVSDLSALFLTDAAKLVAELSEALVRHDHATLCRAAHTLRGSSANFGATGLGRVCERLEAVGVNDDPANVVALVGEVGSELDLVRAALDTWLSTV